METFEAIVGLIEIGAVPLLWYLYKRIQKKLDGIKELEKEIQNKVDENQDLRNKIEMRDLEIKMLRETPK